MTFIEKKVVIVELHGIDEIALLQMRQNRRGALGRFKLLAAIVDRHYAAELATKGAADTGMMDGSSAPKKCWQDIFFWRRQTMEGRPRKIIWRTQMALAVMDVQAEIIFVRKTRDAA